MKTDILILTVMSVLGVSKDKIFYLKLYNERITNLIMKLIILLVVLLCKLVSRANCAWSRHLLCVICVQNRKYTSNSKQKQAPSQTRPHHHQTSHDSVSKCRGSVAYRQVAKQVRGSEGAGRRRRCGVWCRMREERRGELLIPAQIAALSRQFSDSSARNNTRMQSAAGITEPLIVRQTDRQTDYFK